MNAALVPNLRDWTPDGEKAPLMSVMFSVTPEMYDRLRATAKEANVPVSAFCRTAVGAFLADMEGDR